MSVVVIPDNILNPIIYEDKAGEKVRKIKNLYNYYGMPIGGLGSIATLRLWELLVKASKADTITKNTLSVIRETIYIENGTYVTNTARPGEPEGTRDRGKTDTEKLGYDAVTTPNHYTRFKIEPISFIMENNLEFWQGSVIKYVLRYDAKNGLEDLKKARRYLDMQIAKMEGNPDWYK